MTTSLSYPLFRLIKRHGRALLMTVFSLMLVNGCMFSAPDRQIISRVSVTPALRFASAPKRIYYVDGRLGSDINTGDKDQPWRTIQKAIDTLIAGDMVYVRGGQYDGIQTGWKFRNSGTQQQPITLSNYPGEQVVFRMLNTVGDHQIFMCSNFAYQPSEWNTPKADYIRIIGTDVLPQVLSNNVESKKGIVIQGSEGEQSPGIIAHNCDYWEIAGADFVEVATGIFTHKDNWQLLDEYSTDSWYVHDNRVYNYYRESGMQFNGNDNLIENNEIYKVSNRLDTPYGCQLLNILGNNNIIRGNVLSRLGSAANCQGILFEWDLADANLVERNLIYDVPAGLSIQGGDNNTIRNNIIYTNNRSEPLLAGIAINSYDDTKTDWPCDETVDSPQKILPANNPAHPDYKYYYNPRNCHSYGNQIYNNTIHGFIEAIDISPLAGENTIIRNNIFSGWTRSGICFDPGYGFCETAPAEVTASNNALENFKFVNIANFDFHLDANSSLINSGYNLGSLNPYDFDGIPRPQGAGYDIGAYEQ
jgi:parallel beta-helix repeat protein